MREVLVVYNLDKMNSVSESSRMDDFKSEKKNAITNQSVLMNPITKEKKNPKPQLLYAVWKQGHK